MSLKSYSFFHHFIFSPLFQLDNKFHPFFSRQNTSQICTSSLCMGCANLPCIIPILVYMLLKQAPYHFIFKWTDLIDSFPYPLHPALRPFLEVFVVVTAHLGVKYFRYKIFQSSLYLLFLCWDILFFSFVSSIFIVGNVLFLTQQVQKSWFLTWFLCQHPTNGGIDWATSL